MPKSVEIVRSSLPFIAKNGLPPEMINRLLPDRSFPQFRGKESPFAPSSQVNLDVVTVNAAPENYAYRLVPLYPCCWKRLHLFVLEAHDLALTKLERNFERDRADVEHLVRSGYLNAATLRAR